MFDGNFPFCFGLLIPVLPIMPAGPLVVFCMHSPSTPFTCEVVKSCDSFIVHTLCNCVALSTYVFVFLLHPLQEVMAAFRRARETMIANGADAWADMHGFYPGAVAAVAFLLQSEETVFVITTKAKDFAELLLSRCVDILLGTSHNEFLPLLSRRVTILLETSHNEL